MMLALRSILVAYFAVVFSRLPWLVKAVGPLFARALRAGLPGGPNMLVTILGRSSGMPRSFPAAVLPLDDRCISRRHLARCTGLETCVLPVRPC